nr:FAD-dependent oxidoreductase [Sinorhizobium meliloti]
MAERGVNAIVLELVEIGNRRGRWGMVNAALWVMPSAIQQQLGSNLAHAWWTCCAHPRTSFSISSGSMIFSAKQRALAPSIAPWARAALLIRERARHCQELGAPVHILEASETRSRTGAEIFALSLLDLRAGTIQPLTYVRGLAAAAIACGASVFTRSPVSITRENGVWSLRTVGGNVLARSILVRRISIRGYCSRTPWRTGRLAVFPRCNIAADTGAAPRHPSWQPRQLDTQTPMTAFRTDAEGRRIIGNSKALAWPCTGA